ncbi:hypothetical protein [Arachnia propionica]|uniref:Lipoprotein n=1 Tax=Arachnia propionica TaxID=1750 RepID=A0A3P1WV94_9ACTN|nr:hypothetical protein [Arachnia propionica]RRD48283.1 hypothetical protein EII35_13635 [Arachnia propionica]
MYRRHFLSLTGLAVVSATGCTSGLRSPVDAPTPEGHPTAFADSPAWPEGRATVEITAVRDRYLTAMAPVPDADGTFTEGWTAVVVNVTGPTTWALLLEDDGTWTTKQVALRGQGPQVNHEDKALTSIVRGPAVLDDTHAYLVVGLFPLEPGQFTGRPESVYGHKYCPAMLFKIRLSDGSLVASTTVSDALKVERLRHATMSLSTDGGSLLLAAAPGRDDDPAAGGWVGLRLSTADLSVEFDARALYVRTQLTSVSAVGEGLAVTSASHLGKELVLLADGRRFQVAQREPTVLGGWVHLTMPEHLWGAAHVAFHVDSGKRVTMQDPTVQLPELPTISSPYPAIVHLSSGTPFRVWVPGAPEPLHDANRSPGKPSPEGAAVCEDILYTWAESTLTLWRLGSHDPLSTQRITPGRLSPGVGVVTPWGLATPTQFFRATEWSRG